MFEKVVVVDCANHMLGRVASVVAKEIMNGQKVVCVRTEELCISGSLFRHKLIYGKFLIHRGNTNPTRGPNHYRSPSRILWRTVRGMMNHFKARGQAAMERLKVFEGCPHPYDKTKKVVIPQALRVLRLRPGRKFCRLGDLSEQVGWQHDALIKKLEAKRKTKAAAWYTTKLTLSQLKAKAVAAAEKKLGIVRPVKAAKPAKAAAAAAVKGKAAAPAAKKDDKKAAAKPAAKEGDAAAAERKSRAPFRKFFYRGLEVHSLLDLTHAELMKLMTSRVRRRFARGQIPMGLVRKLRKEKNAAAKSGEKPRTIKTHHRNMIIVPEMVGSMIGVYNGLNFTQVEVKPDMIGHYLGEFAITYKPVKHGRAGVGATSTAAKFIPLK